MNHTFKKPLVTEFECPRIITSPIARLRTEHLKGRKIHPDKTRSYVQCKHCPDLQLTPNHILECPTVATKLLKRGMVPLRQGWRTTGTCAIDGTPPIKTIPRPQSVSLLLVGLPISRKSTVIVRTSLGMLRDNIQRQFLTIPTMLSSTLSLDGRTATTGSDVVQSGRPIFDDFFQHLWPYIGNNTANVVFQMVKRLWLIRIDQ
ncbi:hypothetical protein TNCV_4266571 [Trichonephila clavipes]|nr:hypothetical protein TNCV_4266571 [Trichonephila clavipes]